MIRILCKCFIISLLVVVPTANSLFSQALEKTYPLADFTFNSIFGAPKQNDGSVVYCMLGKGFLGTIKSENADLLISSWLQQHPQAQVVPVSVSKSEVAGSEDIEFVYCWIVDKSENLNIYLIQNGVFPGSTMIRPRSNHKDGVALTSKLLIDATKYDNFMRAIKIAESEAFEKKIGIWSHFIEKK